MPCHARICPRVLLVHLLLALCQVSNSAKPTIWPKNEYIIDEGDLLEIICTGTTRIRFTYPLTKEEFFANTSDARTAETEENGIFKHIFQRPTAIPGDTGWYGCADENVDFDTILDNHDDPAVDWLYVYVRSNYTLFVEDVPFGSYEVDTYAGEDVVVPCRPTSPDHEVTAEDIDDDLKNKISFDPKVGFTIKNITVSNSGEFRCRIEKDDHEQEAIYILTVEQDHPVPQPNIHREPHIVRGDDLRMNCTVELQSNVKYLFDWTKQPPKNNTRMSTKQYPEKHINDYSVLLTTEMTILNATKEDEGRYECIITTLRGSKNMSTDIVLHDPENTYISLTLQYDNTYYQVEENKDIQWVVYARGYPKPIVQWYKPQGGEIINDDKFSVTLHLNTSVLKIKRLQAPDEGIYSVVAYNNYTKEQINFTLEVLAKPLTELGLLANFYMPNKTANFACSMQSFPRPNISWSFLQYPNYPLHDNSTFVSLTENVTEEEKSRISVLSKVNMLVEMSGVLTCEACNILGCESSSAIIFVSDGVGAFGIIEPKELVAKGDNVELICAASVYNYTNVLKWKNEKDELINDTERIEIIRNESRFTYRSILKIYNVQESDAQKYICNGQFKSEDNNNIPETSLYDLVVNEPAPPIFVMTNMNKSHQKTITHEPLILKCIVGGLPKPKVTWEKDEKPLKERGPFTFMNDHQELKIVNSSPEVVGKYECRAKNHLKEISTYQYVVDGNANEQTYIILTSSIVILAVILVILGTFFVIKVRREKKMRKELMEAGLMHFEEGALECLNPDLTVDDQAELLPYDKKWEFPRERLKLGKQLGSGAFGVVMKAEAEGICESETVTTVAVKMVRRTTDPTYVRALASELKIMVHLGKHLNVVNLLGACTKNISKRELLVIVEYCHFGNLHNYLLRHRADFINQIDPKTGKLDNSIGLDMLTRTVSVSSSNSLSANSGNDSVHYCPAIGSDSQEICLSPTGGCTLNSNNSCQPDWRSNYRGDYKDHNLKPICTQDLLSWAFQVARGMEYLSQRKVLHGDLAARNILLAEDNIVKICDFGLAKSMYKDGNYKKKGDGPLPIKWMAIESIRDRIFSTQSDIWSYGIVLWEFFTLAETPYPGMEAEKQYQKLIEGYRMEQPEYAMREIYDTMLQCWKAKPTLRPTFTDLVKNIGDLLDESVKSHYISLNTPYMDMNTMVLEGGKNDYLRMMSAPDHVALSSPTHYVNSPLADSEIDPAYLCMSPGSQTDESGIFSPRPQQDRSHFEFPSPASDSEDAVEHSPMLKQEEDPYLKPINVHERRAEFARQRQAIRDQTPERTMDRDSGYCNAPRNLHLIDLDDVDENGSPKESERVTKAETQKKDYPPSIISTHDNYVNMPKQKSDLRNQAIPDSFSNPSYVIMTSHEMDQRA